MPEDPRPSPSLVSFEIDKLSPDRDRDRVNLYLRAFLSESRRRHAGNPHVASLYARTTEFVVRGGKRLRPRLALAAYRIMAGGKIEPPRPIWLAAASLELFHAFMLVHDDLIDVSLARRGHPTLHEAIRRDLLPLGDDETKKLAYDLGIVAGDLLCALGMRLLGRAGLDDASLGRAHRLISDMLLETGVGEALDVIFGVCPLDELSEPQIIDAYLRKTARYSVSGPLVLGATLAGASADATRALTRFGDTLGLCYQLQNDLDALDGVECAEECADLDFGKRTWVLWMAHSLLGEGGREALAAWLEAPVGPKRRLALLRLIVESGAVRECRSRLKSLHHEAVTALADSSLEIEQRNQFLRIISLFGPTPASPPALLIDEVAFRAVGAEVAEGV